MLRQATYFESGSEQIFSLYYPALKEKDVREGVVICPPAPFEMRRSHRALRNLAQNLSKAGYDVIRLDYRGTGDSSGDHTAWNLNDWQADIRAAKTRLSEVHGAERVSVVGLRLGGSLAWKALHGQSIKRFVLWDPIFDGADYYQQLKETHRILCERESDRPPFARPHPQSQVLGFALTDSWIQQLEEFRLDLPKNARGVIVQSHDAIQGRDIGHFRAIDVPDDQQWANPLVLQIQSFAHPCITAIENALEGRV